MSVNNIISNLANLLGLKDSKEATVLRKKASVAESVRLNEELRENIKTEMTDIDNQLRGRKEEYANASASIRLVVKEQILSLMKDRDYLVEKLKAISSRVNANSLLLHKYNSLLFAIKNPSVIDEMEDVRDELDAWARELAQETKASVKLVPAGKEKLEVTPVTDALDENLEFSEPVKEEDPEFLKILESIN